MDFVIMGAIVLGLVQLFKVTSGISSRFIPISALVISIVILLIYSWIEKTNITWGLIENGLIVALSACGLWSGAKATVGK